MIAVAFLMAMSLAWLPPLAVVNLWYAAPLIVSVSLVCAATRHEQMGPILSHAVRFAGWIVVFMVVVMILLTIVQSLA